MTDKSLKPKVRGVSVNIPYGLRYTPGYDNDSGINWGIHELLMKCLKWNIPVTLLVGDVPESLQRQGVTAENLCGFYARKLKELGVSEKLIPHIKSLEELEGKDPHILIVLVNHCPKQLRPVVQIDPPSGRGLWNDTKLSTALGEYGMKFKNGTLVNAKAEKRGCLDIFNFPWGSPPLPPFG